MKALSVKQLVLMSWGILMATGVVLCTVVALSLCFADYRAAKNTKIESAHASLDKISRRLAAEIALPNRGFETQVAKRIAKEFSFKSVCSSSISVCNSTDACQVWTDEFITLQIRNPYVGDSEFTQVTFVVIPFVSFFQTHLLGWSLLLVLVIFLLGASLQTRLIHSKIVVPLEQMHAVSESESNISESWPPELASITLQLRESWNRRDAEVLELLSKGLIHDIRNYLHNVAIATNMVEKSTDHDSDRHKILIQNLVTTASRNLSKVTYLIDRTLDASRDIPVQLAPMPLGTFLQDCVGDMRPVFTKSDVKMSMDMGAENALVMADKHQLGRVLINILQNSVDAIVPHAPTIPQPRRLVMLSVAHANNGVVVSVEDSGPGVEPGFVMNRLKSTKKHGSGIGLYISQKIIKAHGGSLTLDRSETLGGARVAIWIPNIIQPGATYV